MLSAKGPGTPGPSELDLTFSWFGSLGADSINYFDFGSFAFLIFDFSFFLVSFIFFTFLFHLWLSMMLYPLTVLVGSNLSGMSLI